MLKLHNLTKKFDDIVAVDGVSFDVKKGQIVGLLGPNGAGKTTIMRMISGFLTANEGTIEWDDKEVETKSREHRKNVGYLPENNPLYLNLTVREYLNFIGAIKEDRDIKNVIIDCGLTEVMSQKIETLSKGYRQRVGLAATLLGNPKLLVLDEPTSGLDPNQILEVRSLIKRLAKNKAVLLSTHILPEAKALCDRIVIINQGKIVLDDETKKIKNLEKKFVELTV